MPELYRMLAFLIIVMDTPFIGLYAYRFLQCLEPKLTDAEEPLVKRRVMLRFIIPARYEIFRVRGGARHL